MIADQLNVPLETLRSQMLIEPAWGVKKNSEGKNVFWYGFKEHLAVGTKSQYILPRMLIIQYDPEWVATTPCPKRASVRLPHGSLEGRFLPQPGGTAKHLGRREEGDNCCPFSPGWGNRSERETKGFVCFPLWWPFSFWIINPLDILQSIMSPGSLNNGKAAIPLLKGLQKLPLSVRYGIMDAGYDFVPIYQQIYRMEAHSIIAYNKRNEGETLGFDPHFAPTCVREYSYRYDSYDPKYLEFLETNIEI